MSNLCIFALATAIVFASARNVKVDNSKNGMPCSTQVADIGFVVDSSYSIGGDTGTGAEGKAWRQELEFVKSLASKIGISEDGVHLSLIGFSEWASLTIKFNEFRDVLKFNAEVTKTEYQGSNTRIDLALDIAAKEMYLEKNGGRAGVEKLLIFITDGTQTYRRLNREEVNPIQYAVKLREAGVRIIAIGVPDLKGHISISELVGIVGNEKDVHTRDTFDEILQDGFLDNITAESCKRKAATTVEPIVTKKKETESPEVVTKAEPEVVTVPEVITLPDVTTKPTTKPTAPPCTSPCWPDSWLAGYSSSMPNLGVHMNVADYQTCDQLCFAEHRCKFFTFAEVSNSCQMLHVNIYKGSDKGFTSGKVGCSRVDDRLAEQNKTEKK